MLPWRHILYVLLESRLVHLANTVADITGNPARSAKKATHLIYAGILKKSYQRRELSS